MSNYVPATPEQREAFIKEWNGGGAGVARSNNLPVSAMLACACFESGYGNPIDRKTGKASIFSATGNPFNLQKWPAITYPKTEKIIWRDTEVKSASGQVLRAPFNCAKSVPDAVRQWCERILHYGEVDGPPQTQFKNQACLHPESVDARKKLLALRYSPAEFAGNLNLVGFGEKGKDKGYRDTLEINNLTRFD